jgi:hypothetical protein
MANPDRVDLWNTVRQMNHLRANYATFRTDDFAMNTAGFQKTIHLNHPDMNAAVLGNFAVSAAEVVPNFQHGGWWYEYFTGDSLFYDVVTTPLAFEPGEYRLYTDVRVTPPSYFTEAAEALPSQPFEWAAWPNPSHGDLTVELLLEKNAKVRLVLLDCLGRVVTDFGEAELAAGQHRLREHLAVGSGVYLLVVDVEGLVGARKVVVSP